MSTPYSPAFSNRVGFASNPTSPGGGVPASEGWYKDEDGGFVQFGAIFRGVTVNLLALANSFETNLPWLPASGDGNQPIFETLAKLTGNVLTVAVNGNITPNTVVNNGSVLLVTFPVLTGLTGLTTAVITINGTYKAFP